MPARTIAIGDVHGHSAALAGLLRLIEPTANDTIVMLGDYVDGGPDSRGVLDMLTELAGRCQLVPLLGNHDEMMLAAREGRDNLKFWLNLGGGTTLESYGPDLNLSHVPDDHFQFLSQCRPHYEIETHFFIHARYDPWKPLALQDSKTRLWLDLNEENPTKGRHDLQRGRIADQPVAASRSDRGTTQYIPSETPRGEASGNDDRWLYGPPSLRVAVGGHDGPAGGGAGD